MKKTSPGPIKHQKVWYKVVRRDGRASAITPSMVSDGNRIVHSIVKKYHAGSTVMADDFTLGLFIFKSEKDALSFAPFCDGPYSFFSLIKVQPLDIPKKIVFVCNVDYLNTIETLEQYREAVQGSADSGTIKYRSAPRGTYTCKALKVLT